MKAKVIHDQSQYMRPGDTSVDCNYLSGEQVDVDDAIVSDPAEIFTCTNGHRSTTNILIVTKIIFLVSFHSVVLYSSNH